jgi:hypothetical protein
MAIEVQALFIEAFVDFKAGNAVANGDQAAEFALIKLFLLAGGTWH